MFKLLNRMGFLQQIFARMGWGRERSGSIAKERLRLVLIHDQANVSPELLETLKGEIIGVISRYLEIDRQGLEVGLEQRNGSVALAANIPIVRLRRIHAAAAPSPGGSVAKADPAPGGAPRREAQTTREAVPASQTSEPPLGLRPESRGEDRVATATARPGSGERRERKLVKRVKKYYSGKSRSYRPSSS